MIARDGVMHLFPQPFNLVDPRMVGGLEDDLELRIIRQPSIHNFALVDDVVVSDEGNALGAAVAAA